MSKFKKGDKVYSSFKPYEGEYTYVGDSYMNANYALVVDDFSQDFQFGYDDLTLVESNIQRPILEERKIGKVKMQLFDEGFPNAILEIAKVMGWAEENKGYKPNDFKNLPNAETEFSAAASRHRVKGFIQKAQGVPAIERTDEESNIVHLAHTCFNVLAELELVLTGKIK